MKIGPMFNQIINRRPDTDIHRFPLKWTHIDIIEKINGYKLLIMVSVAIEKETEYK